jgi:PilZ domain
MSQDGHFRAHGRRQVEITAMLGRPPSEAPQPIRLINLSLGGACVEVGAALAVGTWVSVEILAPTLWDPLILRGRVVWIRDVRGSAVRAGLHFEHSDAARAFALFELLDVHDYEL